VIQAGPGDTALSSEASRCLNCQLGTQRMMGVRGESGKQAGTPGHGVPIPPEGQKKKVELPLGLSWRVHLRHVLFCFDALILLWIS